MELFFSNDLNEHILLKISEKKAINITEKLRLSSSQPYTKLKMCFWVKITGGWGIATLTLAQWWDVPKTLFLPRQALKTYFIAHRARPIKKCYILNSKKNNLRKGTWFPFVKPCGTQPISSHGQKVRTSTAQHTPSLLIQGSKDTCPSQLILCVSQCYIQEKTRELWLSLLSTCFL